MEETIRRRKERIKTAAIIFLVILLVLTFFSNTLRNLSLAQVRAQQIGMGELAMAVRGSGTVEATSVYSVTAERTAQIESIAVKEGDYVQEGDSLCTYVNDRAEEIAALEQTLKQSEDAYASQAVSSSLTAAQITALESGERTSLSDYLAQIEALRQERDTAQALVSDIQANLTELSRQQSILMLEGKSTTDVERAAIEYTAQLTNASADLQRKESALAAKTVNVNDSIQLAGALDAIAGLQSQLEELTAQEASLEIISGYTGIVRSVTYTAGETASEGDVLFVIAPLETEYKMSFSVTKEQAAQIYIGDTAKTSGYWSSEGVEAVVSGMETDLEDNSRMNIHFTLKGDLTDGQILTLVVEGKSAAYEQVVPNSAVFSDSSGSFIWLLNTEAQTLGNKYTVSRCEVHVLAVGENMSAIRADVPQMSYIVTTSSASLTDGEQVRLALE